MAYGLSERLFTRLFTDHARVRRILNYFQVRQDNALEESLDISLDFRMKHCRSVLEPILPRESAFREPVETQARTGKEKLGERSER